MTEQQQCCGLEFINKDLDKWLDNNSHEAEILGANTNVITEDDAESKLIELSLKIKELEHQNEIYRQALHAISKVSCSSNYYRAKANEALVEGERC